MVRVSTSLIRIDRMAIPVAGSTWDGSKADMPAGKSGQRAPHWIVPRIKRGLSSPYCRRSRNRDPQQASTRPLWVAY